MQVRQSAVQDARGSFVKLYASYSQGAHRGLRFRGPRRVAARQRPDCVAAIPEAPKARLLALVSAPEAAEQQRCPSGAHCLAPQKAVPAAAPLQLRALTAVATESHAGRSRHLPPEAVVVLCPAVPTAIRPSAYTVAVSDWPPRARPVSRGGSGQFRSGIGRARRLCDAVLRVAGQARQ